jgi:hypothetical protein
MLVFYPPSFTRYSVLAVCRSGVGKTNRGRAESHTLEESGSRAITACGEQVCSAVLFAILKFMFRPLVGEVHVREHFQ